MGVTGEYYRVKTGEERFFRLIPGMQPSTGHRHAQSHLLRVGRVREKNHKGEIEEESPLSRGDTPKILPHKKLAGLPVVPPEIVLCVQDAGNK